MAIVVPNDGSKLDFFTYGACTLIYWCSEDYQVDVSFSLCADCANDPRWRGEVKMVEASADYEHDIRCDNCGYYLVYCWLREKVEPCFEGCNKVIPTIGKE